MWQIISAYLGVIILIVGLLVFAQVVLEKKPQINIWKLILLIIIISIFHTVLQLNFSGTIKSTVMCIINIIFFKYVFSISYKKSIFLTIIYMIVLLIPDLIEIFFITKVLNLSMDFCFNSLSGTLISNTAVCLMFLGITFLMKNHLRYLINAEIDNNKKIIILSSLTLISILIFFYQLGQQYRENKNIIIFLIIILFLISMLGSLIRQIIINNKIKNDYDNLLEFMTTYEEEIENQRTLRHETKNEFLAIRAKICDKEKESEIINYIDEILGDTYSVKSEKYAKFGYLPANGIKGLCYFKVQKAEELGINVSINISKKIKKSTVFDLDLKQQREFAKILGVFIDNAIEASAESKDKELGIEAYSNLENEFRMIISNTYNNAIDEEKIGKENFTTKGKNRGHGLLLVNEIVKNNTIFETKRNIKNDIYSQTIIVKKS